MPIEPGTRHDFDYLHAVADHFTELGFQATGRRRVCWNCRPGGQAEATLRLVLPPAPGTDTSQIQGHGTPAPLLPAAGQIALC